MIKREYRYLVIDRAGRFYTASGFNSYDHNQAVRFACLELAEAFATKYNATVEVL